MIQALDFIATLMVGWLSIDPIRVILRSYHGTERIVGFGLLGAVDAFIIAAIWL